MTYIHNLDGCSPVPLAHYLKALGILRLVSEQADHQARGWWEGDRFRLAVSLSVEELERFFLERYEPTPFVSPWNKGSGFYGDDDPGLGPIERSSAARFRLFRTAIVASRECLQPMSEADSAVRRIKTESKQRGLTKAQRDAIRKSSDYKERLAAAERGFARAKSALIPELRRKWRGPHREWMDAAMVLGSDAQPRFPALLGTGGNDGRLDFTNNFMQRLADLFDLSDEVGGPLPETKGWLAGALWGNAVPGYRRGSAVGQYLPGTAGGANNANGPEAESLVNPFDFVLMMEGTVLFSSHSTRRMGATEQTRAAAPFSVTFQGAGYASAAGPDEGPRGEQWMPLWRQPISLVEFRWLLAEGRAQIGQREAATSLDLARAVARLGVARGVASFQRYAYIERNGQSNLAVPLGRFVVPEHASPKLACLDDLDAWLPRFHRLAIDGRAPARLTQAERRLADALFAVAQHPDEAPRWQAVLAALAAVEGVMKRGSGFGAGPVPPLRPAWVLAADDGSHELTLALALALQRAGYDGENAPWWNTTRRHWLPLDPSRPGNGRSPARFARSGTGRQSRLQIGPEVVMDGRRGLDDAIALIDRRLAERCQAGAGRVPLLAGWRAAAPSNSLAALLAGEVDLDRTMALARGLMALDARAWAKQPPLVAPSGGAHHPDDGWLVIRLALLPWSLEDWRGGEIRIATDPAIFRRLAAGDAGTAVALSLRRLAAAGIRTAVRAATVSADTARLWAAALAFPVTQRTAKAFLRWLDPTVIEKEVTA